MALESVSAAETLIQSNDNDLEDGEIPSDEDDEPVTHTANNAPEAAKPIPKPDLVKKTFESKFNKNKKQQQQQLAQGGKHERFLKYKGPVEDWAGDVEKAIKAAMEEDGGRNQEIKIKNKNNRNKARKRIRDEREEERGKEQKKRKISDDENGNEDEDEMLFVRGASPIRKDVQENNSPRRANEQHETFENTSDYEERPPAINRHRENENKRGAGRGGGRRGGKNERGKNKTRGQMRNDRNGRRPQNNDHGSNYDPDTICLYYMQGKCHRGDDCPFSHNALPPRKMELCKFYLMDCCAKREKCLYMHQDFPCKFFHTGLKCNQGDNCKFSHQPLSDQVKAILLKHLESAPKEILGDFPRLSREGAILMINNTARSLAQGQEAANQKIPSLFELNLSAPTDKNDEKDDKEELMGQQKGNMRERKPSGKRTRWGSDEDRVPYEQIMLLQANELCLQLPNVALGLAQQHNNTQLQQKPAHLAAPPTDFYAEINSESNKNMHNKVKEDFTKDIGEDDILEQPKKKNRNVIENRDIDLRQMLKAKKLAPVYSIADEVANLTKNKVDDESDQDEESDLVIEMPAEEDDKEKSKHASTTQCEQLLIDSSFTDEQEVPSHLPKKAQELFMRIQQQQRAAQDSFKNMDSDTNAERTEQVMEDWYSDEEDDDDDDDESGNLTIVDSSKDEIESTEKSQIIKKEFQAPASVVPNVPQPAAIVDKLGDLSKIDISAEVSKLLSTLKAQSSTGKTQASGSSNQDTSKTKSTQESMGETSSPRVSPDPTPPTAPVSRDPRMSRDPRQRRDEQKPSSPSISDSKRDSQKHLRLETSIYSSGITPMDTHMDTDLRTKTDQDLRRQDMDFRQRFQTGFGDTDLRVVGASFTDASTKSDVDLRQILSLPFKPAPSHMPCTEIDASIASHPPMTYKVYVVDIPRPDYTGLKLTKNDTQVKYDPRLRKIFRIGKAELVADSPMSPPPVVKQETPKSPPQIRSDPRRKTLEAAASSQSAANANTMMPKSQPMDMGANIGLGPGGMPVPPGMPGGPPPNMSGPGGMMPMGPNYPMGMGNMGPMRPMMNAPMPPQNMPPMGMNGPPMPMPQGQMNYDPRFNVQRNNGVGLLGPGPGNFGPDVNNSYEGGAPPPYPGGNFNNFGPGGGNGNGGGGSGGPGGPGDSGMMGFNPNASNPPNFMSDGADWVPGNGNRRGGRIRRRNRNRTNMVANN